MDIQTIGIIGYGYVGQAVHAGFNKPTNRFVICDPKYNDNIIEDVVAAEPACIFVCVPTNNLDFTNLYVVLNRIELSDYQGVVVIKSTVMPHVIKDREVVINPEFLTQRTANHDFIRPPMLLLGGNRANEVKLFYQDYSLVLTDKIFLTDNVSACMCKYMMNCFYATKICFMNVMHQIATEEGANSNDINNILRSHEWMGTNHFDVPGPDGRKGFGGACLPKDMSMFAEHYDIDLFHKILSINELQRNDPQNFVTD